MTQSWGRAVFYARTKDGRPIAGYSLESGTLAFTAHSFCRAKMIQANGVVSQFDIECECRSGRGRGVRNGMV